jgi:hypothetical protein
MVMYNELCHAINEVSVCTPYTERASNVVAKSYQKLRGTSTALAIDTIELQAAFRSSGVVSPITCRSGNASKLCSSPHLHSAIAMAQLRQRLPQHLRTLPLCGEV